MDTDLEVTSNGSEVKVYKYRWIVLFIFCLFTVCNFMQFLQFTIVANIMTKSYSNHQSTNLLLPHFLLYFEDFWYFGVPFFILAVIDYLVLLCVCRYYGVESFAVDATGLIFFLVYILMFLPISYLIERYSLKVTAVVSTGLTLAGNLVKILGADPSRFYVILIGQTLCAIGQVYMLSIPSKFASVWFGPDEVSTACAIAVLGTQLGAALGSVIPPFVVKKDDDDDIVGKNIRDMMIYNAVASAVVFIIVAAFFRSRPKLPPSLSQLQLLSSDTEQPPFLANCKKLIRNRDFLLLLLAFGIFNGLWNSFGILVNTLYIHYFPDGENDIGIITLIAIISGGCIGSVVFGLVLDKTHKFKTISMGLTLMSAMTYIFVVYSLLSKSRIGSYVTIPLFGFFTASGLVISFEYTLEVTYPIPESVSCSVMNATIFCFAIIWTLAIEGLIAGIGYLNSFIAGLVVLLCCTCILFFISSNLRRRNANIVKESGEAVLNNCTAVT